MSKVTEFNFRLEGGKYLATLVSGQKKELAAQYHHHPDQSTRWLYLSDGILMVGLKPEIVGPRIDENQGVAQLWTGDPSGDQLYDAFHENYAYYRVERVPENELPQSVSFDVAATLGEAAQRLIAMEKALTTLKNIQPGDYYAQHRFNERAPFCLRYTLDIIYRLAAENYRLKDALAAAGRSIDTNHD